MHLPDWSAQLPAFGPEINVDRGLRRGKVRRNKNIASDSRAELAIARKLYPVTLTPVTARVRSEALDAAYAEKYDMAAVFGDELPSWRYYHVSADR